MRQHVYVGARQGMSGGSQVQVQVDLTHDRQPQFARGMAYPRRDSRDGTAACGSRLRSGRPDRLVVAERHGRPCPIRLCLG
jgi:hypothetical protein